MAITPLPTPPLRSVPSTFIPDGQEFLGALPQFVAEVNATAVQIETITALNYVGAWGDQTGPAAVPYAVSHSGKYWQLTENLADVTASEPGVDPEWIEIHGSVRRVNYTDDDSPVTLTDAMCAAYLFYTNTGAVAETVLELPPGGDGLIVNATVTAAYDFTLTADGTETIRYLDKVSIAGGSLKAGVIGHQAQLVWSGTEWIASVVGAEWYLETS